MVMEGSRIRMFFMPSTASRISLPACGAQEPFSIRATVRFWKLCAFRSNSRFSMGVKRPLLYVAEASTRWLQRKASLTISET